MTPAATLLALSPFLVDQFETLACFAGSVIQELISPPASRKLPSSCHPPLHVHLQGWCKNSSKKFTNRHAHAQDTAAATVDI